MEQGNLQSIVIAGGGTAGWMTAAALSANLPAHLCAITVVESETIATIGVGEATIPTIQLYNRLAGVDDAHFLATTGATFKLGIAFSNWLQKGHEYFHPFGRYGQDFGTSAFYQHWLRARSLGDETDLADYSLNVQAAKRGKMRTPDPDPRSVYSSLSYAYHLDAHLYGQYLRELAQSRGVIRREGMIKDVTVDAVSGHIKDLRLDDGGVIEGDLFIDCTGMRARLMGEALGISYQDWSHYLPCNRAIALPTNHIDLASPYTRATAQSGGWQWRIPLRHRMGNGLVYCADFCSDSQALDTLLGHVEGRALADPKPIQFTTGRREKFWQGNCLAIGMSAGFLEPLESTSIHLIQTAITKLLSWFPTRSIDPLNVAEFNRQTINEYERTRDFLVLHYHATHRDDSEFWRHCRTMEIPDTLKEKIEVFRRTGRLVTRNHDFFQEASWLAVMLGQGIMPEQHDPLTLNIRPLDLDRILQGTKALILRAANDMPNQADYLREILQNSGVPEALKVH